MSQVGIQMKLARISVNLKIIQMNQRKRQMHLFANKAQQQFLELKADVETCEELSEGDIEAEGEGHTHPVTKVRNPMEKSAILSITNFIRPDVLIVLVVISAILIVASLGFSSKSLKAETESLEISAEKILEFSSGVSPQIKESQKAVKRPVFDIEVKELSGEIKDLENKVSHLKNELLIEKDKQKLIMEAKARQRSAKNNTRASESLRTHLNTNQEFKSEGSTQFSMRQPPRMNADQTDKKDMYEFSNSMNEIVHHSAMKVIYRSVNISQGIQRETFERAVRLMEVTHNVNSKGKFVMDHYNFYANAKKKYDVLSKLVKEEKEYYNRKYETEKYIHQQIGMCVFVNSYNHIANRLYLRNLDSIFQQKYQNFHIVYFNDASSEETDKMVLRYMEENQIPKDKYVIVNNVQRSGAGTNAYKAAMEHCKLGEVMVMMEGGDSFIGREVLSVLNAVYQKGKVAVSYGTSLDVEENKVKKGNTQQIRQQQLENGYVRQIHIASIPALRTAYVDIIRQIKEKYLQSESTKIFYNAGSQLALMISAIQLAGTRVKLLPELVYEHRVDRSGVDEFSKARQKQIFMEIWNKGSGQKVTQMPFADNPITVNYP